MDSDFFLFVVDTGRTPGQAVAIMFRTELEGRAFRTADYPPHNHVDCNWDMVSWRRHHVLCESCGVPFIMMSPMADMIRHWTGACAWQKSDTDPAPAVAASMAVVDLLQDVSWIVPPNTREANQLRLAIRLLRDLPQTAGRSA
jgi:hypothetical protein